MAKAQKVKGIAPQKSLEKCARRIITTRLHEMMSFKEGAIDGTDIEYVHDMRVSSRRLRAAMRNFSDCFPKRKFKKHSKTVQNITSTMGGVRDLDVLIDYFQKDMETLSGEEQIGVQNLVKHLQQKREQSRKPMLKMFSKLDASGFEKQYLKFFKT